MTAAAPTAMGPDRGPGAAGRSAGAGGPAAGTGPGASGLAAAAAGGLEVRSLGMRDPLALPLLARDLVRRYLIFDACVGGARRVDLHPLVLPPALHRAAVSAAEGVAAALDRCARRAHTDPAERARYGLHPDVLALSAASHAAGDGACLSRVDLLYGEDGAFHACEINADCPGGHNEALGLPALAQAAGFWEGVDPTRVLAVLVDRLAARARGQGGPAGAVALLYATAYAEDLQVCALIARALERRGVRAILCPATAPRLRGERLCVNGEPVAALYRFFPAEYMEGQDNLPDLIAAVSAGAAASVSSFASIFLQSKLAMARAWALAPGLPPAEAAAVRAHLPETFALPDPALPPERLRAERAGWVIKRALGRVGDEVFVGALMDDEGWGEVVAAVAGGAAGDGGAVGGGGAGVGSGGDGAAGGDGAGAGDRWIAQRFVAQRPVPTPFGPRLVTLGAYLMDGRFCGYFARLTPYSHVSHDALCVPVFVGAGAAGRAS